MLVESNISDSTSQRFAWLEEWKATAARRLDLIRQRVRELFDGKRRHVETRPARVFGKRVVRSKGTTTGRSGVRGGYIYYLPSATPLSDFTIWRAFHPDRDDEVRSFPSKARITGYKEEFCILCAFFPEDLEEVCIPLSNEVLPKPYTKVVKCIVPECHVPNPLSLMCVPTVKVLQVYCQQLERETDVLPLMPLASQGKIWGLPQYQKELMYVGIGMGFHAKSHVDIFLNKLFTVLIGIKRMMAFFHQASHASACNMLVLRAANLLVLHQSCLVSRIQMAVYEAIAFVVKIMSAIKVLNSVIFALRWPPRCNSIVSFSSRVASMQARNGHLVIMPRAAEISGQIAKVLPSLQNIYLLRSGIYEPRPIGKDITRKGFKITFDSQRMSEIVASLKDGLLKHHLQERLVIANRAEVKQIHVMAQKFRSDSLRVFTSMLKINGSFGRSFAKASQPIFVVSNLTAHGVLVRLVGNILQTIMKMFNTSSCPDIMGNLQMPCKEVLYLDDANAIKESQPLPISSADERILMFHTSPESQCEQTFQTPSTGSSFVETPETYASGYGSHESSPDDERLMTASPRLLRRHNRIHDIGYSKETLGIFLQIEHQYKADPGYLEWQWDITHQIRGSVISWMTLVTDYLNMCTASLFLAVNLLDRYLSLRNVNEEYIQLLATSCILIAGKFEEDMAEPNVHVLTRLCGGAYKFDEILDMERYTLLKLDCHVFVPTAAWFCAEYLYICEGDEKLEHLTMFFAELTLMDLAYLNAKPSMIAAAALSLARYYLEARIWTLELWEKCHYLPMDVLQIMKYIIVSYTTYRDTEDAARHSIHNKYSTEKYHEVAKLVNFSEAENARIEEKCIEFGELLFGNQPRSHTSLFHGYGYISGDIPLPRRTETSTLAVQNPLPCREACRLYDTDAYRIMLAAENKGLADPSYILMQTAITEEIRQAEVNWLIRHLESTGYTSSTLILAVNIMDRFLSQRFVKKEMFRLLTATCLMIAMKFETRHSFDINTILGAVDQTYVKSHLIQTEALILSVLDFNIMAPTASWFSEELFDVYDAEDTLKELTRYLMEMTTLETRYLEYRPSQIAAAAHSIARYSLGHPPWTKDLLERSAYKLEDFCECLNDLFEDYKVSSSRFGELQCKYRKLRHMTVADVNYFPVPDSGCFHGQYSKAMEHES